MNKYLGYSAALYNVVAWIYAFYCFSHGMILDGWVAVAAGGLCVLPFVKSYVGENTSGKDEEAKDEQN